MVKQNSKKSEKPLPKIIALIGPTATGKSDLAVEIARAIPGLTKNIFAKKIGAEIVSADSRQIYKGMDIGTGKITKKEMRGIRHHLLDIADPGKKMFNVVRYKKAADKAIAGIIRRGNMPILTGGTGFWVDTVIENKEFDAAPPNAPLRKKLNVRPTDELFDILKKLDPKRARSIDQKNPHRLIRAIEIAEFHKNHPQIKSVSNEGQPQPIYHALILGLDMPTPELHQAIEKRMLSRFKQGMVKEVMRLHKNISYAKLEEFGLEYKYIALFLQKKLSKEQMSEQLLYAIKHYAKRQRTWFKRNPNIIWLTGVEKNAKLNQALKLTEDFIAGKTTDQ